MDGHPYTCSHMMDLVSVICDEGLKQNKMPVFIKHWRPTTVPPQTRDGEQPGMNKSLRRNLEQCLYISMDFLEYMIEKYGPETLPKYSQGKSLK